MDMKRRFLLLLAGATLAVFGQVSGVYAQDVAPASYEDIIARLQAVEQQVASQNVQNGPAESAPGGGGCCQSCCDCCCPPPRRWYARYDSVYVEPRFTRNVAFQVFDVNVAVGEDVQLIDFDWDLEYSPRVEVGYLSGCGGLGWRARYWHFDHGVSARLNDPGTGRVEFGLHDDPDLEIETDDTEFAEAVENIELKVFDLELSRQWDGCCGSLTASLGVRYVSMDQFFRGSIADIATGEVDEFVQSDFSFEGIGPTLALEGVRRSGYRNWSVFANTRVSLLFGDSERVQFAFDPQDPADPIDDLLTENNDFDVKAIAEVQLGVQYDYYLRNCAVLFFRAGLEAQYWPHWGGAGSQNGEDTDGIGEDPFLSDMGFVGFTGSVGLAW
jgi:hypothetical protein